MLFEVQAEKDGKFWLIEVPALDVMTQGQTKKDACQMLVDAIELLIDRPDSEVCIIKKGRQLFLSASDPDRLIALMLRRQREKYGLTL